MYVKVCAIFSSTYFLQNILKISLKNILDLFSQILMDRLCRFYVDVCTHVQTLITITLVIILYPRSYNTLRERSIY